jgi:predicted ArsR family transcriptional regulator
MALEETRRTSTRRQILTLLCIEDQSAAQLAGRIGISPNAVREQLARLKEDRLVEHEVIRAGVGKPGHRYRLTGEGEAAVSAGYLPVLKHLVAEVGDRMGRRALEAVLRGTGSRLSNALGPRPEGDTLTRARAAAETLTRLGGVAAAAEKNGALDIRCECCAIGALVSEEPLACGMMAAALSSYLNLPVQERCDRSGRPKCRFELAR